MGELLSEEVKNDENDEETKTESEGFSKLRLFDCPQCKNPINLKKLVDKVFCGCSGYPSCKWYAFLPAYILKAVPKE